MIHEYVGVSNTFLSPHVCEVNLKPVWMVHALGTPACLTWEKPCFVVPFCWKPHLGFKRTACTISYRTSHRTSQPFLCPYTDFIPADSPCQKRRVELNLPSHCNTEVLKWKGGAWLQTLILTWYLRYGTCLNFRLCWCRTDRSQWAITHFGLGGFGPGGWGLGG